MPTKKEDREQYEHWCECEYSQCDIGAHERSSSKECHMPKWQDADRTKIKKRPTS
jgi:hypothetical protein